MSRQWADMQDKYQPVSYVQHSRGYQRGVTLVELMVAMVIGLIITAGVLNVFTSSKQSYRTVQASSELQENARYAMEVLQQNLRQAGFVRNSWEPTGAQINVIDNPVDGAQSSDGVAGTSDTITVRFQADEDCIGQATTTATTPNFLAVNTFSVNANNELICTAGGNTQPLVENVLNMQVLYGVDVDSNRVADRYEPASSVSDWTQVVSARIGLLMANRENSVTTAPISFDNVTTNPSLELFNQDADTVAEVFGATNTASDNRMYKVFTTTVTFRNRVP